MSTGLLGRVVEREPMNGHDGRSGARLERAVLEDGRRVVIKTASPAVDLAMTVSGDTDGRERRLWLEGALDRLPPGVGHCILDAQLDDQGQIVTVMSDLGDDVLGWGDRLSATDTERIIDAAARMHHTFTGSPPTALMPLERWLTLLSPAEMAQHVGGPNPIARAAVQGWACLSELVSPTVAKAITAVHRDPGPLANRLRSGSVTLTHGDLWPVNLALRETDVVILDWSLATASPGVVDLATFVTASQDVSDVSPDAMVDQYVEASGCGTAAVADAFLAVLCVFGWNTALAATRSERARRQLDWWTTHAA